MTPPKQPAPTWSPGDRGTTSELVATAREAAWRYENINVAELLSALADQIEAQGTASVLRDADSTASGAQVGPASSALSSPDTPAPGLGEDDWRPEVRAFADLMEAKLRANDHKPGWKGEDWWPLLYRLREETLELQEELAPGSRTDLLAWSARVGREAADVANFAMMIADVCGALPAPPLQSRAPGIGGGENSLVGSRAKARTPSREADRDREPAGEDAQPFKDALHDLVMLRAQDDIGCVPPPTKEQWAKAWAEAEELTRNEP